MEEVLSLVRIFDVGIDEERVSFRVNILHHDLEPIETPCFSDLDFVRKTFDEVFIHNAIRGGEKGKNMGDEMTLACGQVLPVPEVMRKINFFSGPKRRLGFLVKCPDLMSLYQDTE